MAQGLRRWDSPTDTGLKPTPTGPNGLTGTTWKQLATDQQHHHVHTRLDLIKPNQDHHQDRFTVSG